MVGITWKHHGAAGTDRFLNQRQNAIERKCEIESINAAVNVNQIAALQTQIVDENTSKIRFAKRVKRSNPPPLALPFGAAQMGHRGRRENRSGNFAEVHLKQSGSLQRPRNSPLRIRPPRPDDRT